MSVILESELLRDLEGEAVQSILALAAPQTLPAGHVLFELGAEAESLSLIRQGRVSLTLPVHVEGGTADLLIEEKTAGEVVGWSALIPPHRFTLKAETTVETSLLVIPREPLLALLSADPALGYRLTRSVASVVAQRLHVFQAMWLRQMQRLVEGAPAAAWGAR